MMTKMAMWKHMVSDDIMKILGRLTELEAWQIESQKKCAAARCEVCGKMDFAANMERCDWKDMDESAKGVSGYRHDSVWMHSDCSPFRKCECGHGWTRKTAPKKAKK